MSNTAVLATDIPFVDALAAIVGADNVTSDVAELTFFSSDMAERGVTAAAVIRPRTTLEVAAAVKLCVARKFPMIPRGGGFSYTGGYRPVRENTVTFDLRGLDRIIEINTVDMYVVVEPGCTWRTLYEALKEKGVRTPYFGPMSGYSATVGGALSQGSFFLGSTQYGPVADSALALEVVTGEGTVLKTGSWASTNAMSPFFRSYGPDLTGLFLGDNGALGFKTKAVLRLIPFPPQQEYGSFAFDDEEAAIAATSEIGRATIAAECYCWDPYFVKQMSAASTGLTQDLQFLAGVAKGGTSRVKGLMNAARVAVAGRRAFASGIFLLHVIVDDVSEAGAKGRIDVAREIALRNGGREMPPSVPMALRGTPFTNFNVPERRTLQRNLPTNGLTTHSRIQALGAAVRTLIATYQDDFDRLGIQCGVIYFAVGNGIMCCEPLVYFDDEQHFQHDRIAERSDLDKLAAHATPPESARVAVRFRTDLTKLMSSLGCGHVQIGKSYPYRQTREAATFELLAAVKRAVDPHGLVNPGALGLGTA